MEITNFKIKKLFGNLNVDIPIKDNKLILIGVNGTGKTTILTMLFHILRGDFVELSAYDFEEISVMINSKEFKISYDALEESFFELSPKLKKFKDEIFAGSVKHKIYPILLKSDFEPSVCFELLNSLFPEDEGISYAIQEFFSPYDDASKYSYIIDMREEFNKNKRLPNDVCDILNNIKNNLENTEILFLPTFRRIETEFYRVFKCGLPPNLQMKIINFGVGDIKKLFSRVSYSSPNYLNSRLDVAECFRESDESVAFALEESVNKSRERIRNENFTERLQKFIEVYNKYISDSSKEILCNIDDVGFSIKTDKNDVVALENLSFGEKQILYIFSELYLSEDDKEYMVIIDEPELSLSVLWQERFLPDILASGKCKFLAAVTHSPFIYNNELEPYSQDISRLISVDEDK